MFYYYGSKRRLAPKYPPPQHSTIVEPFAGAAGYAVYHLLRDESLRAVLVEKDPRVVELWRRLLNMSDADVEALRCPSPGHRSEDFLVMCVAASNALARCKGFTVTERAAKRFVTLRNRLLRELPALRGRVEVIEGDYTLAPVREDATYLIDPPYEVREHRFANNAGDGYAYGCRARDMDYAQLATWCKSLPGQVIVCEAEGAEWLPFERLHETTGSQSNRSVEVVWCKEDEV